MVKYKLFLFSGLAVLALTVACTTPEPTTTPSPTPTRTFTPTPLPTLRPDRRYIPPPVNTFPVAFVAQWGGVNRPGQLNWSNGLAVDGDGNVYVAESRNHRVQVFTTDGEFLRQWHPVGNGGDTPWMPLKIAVDSQREYVYVQSHSDEIYIGQWYGIDQESGERYVGESRYARTLVVIEKFTLFGDFLGKLVEFPASGSPRGSAKYCGLTAVSGEGAIALVCNDDSVLYLDDSGTVTSRRDFGIQYGPNGGYIVALDRYGNAYSLHHDKQTIEKTSSGGSTLWSIGAEATGTGQRGDPIFQPSLFAVDDMGNFYLGGEATILKFNSNRELVGSFPTDPMALGSNRGLWLPSAMTVDADGNVYVLAESYRVVKFNAEGQLVATWGSDIYTDETIFVPYGVAVDTQGNVYATDGFTKRVLKFDNQGKLVRTTQVGGIPDTIAVDGSGTVYFTDRGDNLVRVIDPSGNLSDQWEIPGSSDEPDKVIAIDTQGNVIVTNDDAALVLSKQGHFLRNMHCPVDRRGRHIPPAGVAIGQNGRVYLGCGLTIEVFSPEGQFIESVSARSVDDLYYGQYFFGHIAVDQQGRIYSAKDDTIRVFDASGEYLGQWGRTGANEGEFGFGGGVEISIGAQGHIYVADRVNRRIQIFAVEESLLIEEK